MRHQPPAQAGQSLRWIARGRLMDVVFTVGEYNLVSMALKTFRVPMDEGVEGFPK